MRIMRFGKRNYLNGEVLENKLNYFESKTGRCFTIAIAFRLHQTARSDPTTGPYASST